MLAHTRPYERLTSFGGSTQYAIMGASGELVVTTLDGKRHPMPEYIALKSLRYLTLDALRGVAELPTKLLIEPSEQSSTQQCYAIRHD